MPLSSKLIMTNIEHWMQPFFPLSSCAGWGNRLDRQAVEALGMEYMELEAN